MDQHANRDTSSAERATTQVRFEALLREHYAALWEYAFRRVGDRTTAEDILQEACVRAWRAFPGFRGDSSFETWMRWIIKRQAIDYWRAQFRRSRTAERLVGEVLAEATSRRVHMEDEVVTAQLRVDDVLVELGVAELVAAWPERQAFAFRMRCEHALLGTPQETVPAIAKALDISLKAAEHLDYRARQRAKEQWAAARKGAGVQGS